MTSNSRPPRLTEAGGKVIKVFPLSVRGGSVLRKYYYYYYFSFFTTYVQCVGVRSRWTAEEVENSVMPPPPPPPLPRKVIRGPFSPPSLRWGHSALCRIGAAGVKRARPEPYSFSSFSEGIICRSRLVRGILCRIAFYCGGGETEGKFFGILFHFPSFSA